MWKKLIMSLPGVLALQNLNIDGCLATAGSYSQICLDQEIKGFQPHDDNGNHSIPYSATFHTTMIHDFILPRG